MWKIALVAVAVAYIALDIGVRAIRKSARDAGRSDAEVDGAEGVIDGIERGRKAREDANRVANDGGDDWVERL